ncbi:hypothetical protein [Micromonospora chalcea]|uniref:hypothetical protein n=1 Tax=Micromonospora chalcea TaxID=1874 RepID=UPI0023DDD75A|nr:hypothetical protein [Micromonospora chalcea]
MPSPEPAARSRRPAEESVPTEPSSEDETPKRTRRAPAAKKATPKKAAPIKAAPAVKKATRKATLPKQAALDPPVEAQPHDKTENLPATVDGRHAARTQERGWRAVGPQLRDHPGFAPELLALAAVDALGPRARDWVAQVRRAYPEADADGVARLATRRFVRMAGTGGALAAGAGMFAPVAELAAVLWTQANLVLHVAAAYGRDPAHPDRAAELLVLTLVHPDDGTARAALAAARAADEPADGPWGRVAEAAWRLATPVAAQAGGWLGLRLAARRLPGAAALAAAIGGTATAERVAARAVARYRPGRT